MASRAHLLAGLRTGGPRSSSPFEGDRFEQEQSSPRANNASPAGATTNTVTLKANAAPFTPNKRTSASAIKDAEGQAAAFRMQQAIAAASSQRQASYSTGEDFAAMYGASQGQPQQADYQQQDMGNLIRQKQAQMLQNQILAQQQQQQQQQQQMEMYRLQAASQQQQHLQQVAVQQRLLLAQMQAEYNQQQHMSSPASLQASLRQRQAEQMYAQLMQQQGQQQQEEAQVQQQQQLLQQLQFLQMQAAAMQGMQDMSFGEDSPQAMSTPSRRNASSRAESPSVGQQNRRDRQASQTAADNATSWRSTPTSLSKATSKLSNGRNTPSIVVDDSASEKSDEAGTSLCEDNETPETSEEDISAGVVALAKDVSAVKLTAESRESSVSPRPLSLSQAPRNRAFSTDVKASTPVNGAGTAVSSASRQPRGPPTEFLAINFTSRLSARTRKEAMSKLCASPRAASFNMTSRSAVVA